MKQVIELRASNAHRWMTCHGQPKAVAGMLESSSSAADKGTCAHALLEIMLRLDIPTDEIGQFEGKPILKTLGEGASKRRVDHILVDEDMMKGVSYALDYVRSYRVSHKKAQYEIEAALDAEPLIGYPCGGTSDVLITDLPREIVVVDYKNGVGFVDHEDNEQLHIYGIGALCKYQSQVTPDTRIRMVIVQPNSRGSGGPVREIVYTYEDLIIFANKANAAAKAAHGKNPARVAGEHCGYCRAAGVCKTFANKVTEDAGLEFAEVTSGIDMTLRDPRNMNVEELANVVKAARTLRQWLDNVEAEGIRQLLAGNKVPGYKLVGSRPHRRWDDDQAVLAHLKKYPSLLAELAPPTLKSPSVFEKRLGRKRDGMPKLLAKLQPQVTHNPVEPRIAPLDDNRPSFRAADDFLEE